MLTLHMAPLFKIPESDSQSCQAASKRFKYEAIQITSNLHASCYKLAFQVELCKHMRIIIIFKYKMYL